MKISLEPQHLLFYAQSYLQNSFFHEDLFQLLSQYFWVLQHTPERLHIYNREPRMWVKNHPSCVAFEASKFLIEQLEYDDWAAFGQPVHSWAEGGYSVDNLYLGWLETIQFFCFLNHKFPNMFDVFLLSAQKFIDPLDMLGGNLDRELIIIGFDEPAQLLSRFVHPSNEQL